MAAIRVTSGPRFAVPEGWVQFDATGPTRCHAELIPLVSTDTGDPPFVYASDMVVEKLDAFER